MLDNFTGNDLEHYAGVAKENNLLNDWERHFIYNIGALLYHQENGADINITFKQNKCAIRILTQLADGYSAVDSCCLSKSKTPCSRCQKLKIFKPVILNRA